MGAPRRYRDGRGYIRLRWLVGPQSYVEVYEHRLVLGLPDAEVHHGNDDKADNRPENLHALSPSEHAKVHGERAAYLAAARRAERSAARQTAFESARAAKVDRWLQFAAMYREGKTTTQIAAVAGLNHGTISRGLRGMGVQMRPCGGHNRLDLDEEEVARLLTEPGARAGAVARHFGVSLTAIIRIRDARGIPAARPGRPPAVTR